MRLTSIQSKIGGTFIVILLRPLAPVLPSPPCSHAASYRINSGRLSKVIGEIAAASNEQAQGISQINVGLQQIDQVIQQTTVSADESAATSEELSSQTAHLNSMLGRFVLKDGEDRRRKQPS